jgi:isoleucyl-tRNA synthetase
MYVHVARDAAPNLSEYYNEIIKEELNIKEIVFTDSTSDYTTYTFKPQLKTLGRRFGAKIGAVKDLLAALNGAKAYADLVENGSVVITIDGTEERLEKEDLLIDVSQKEGFVSSTDKNITVVIDTALTDELRDEGLLREVISKVQTMRKEAGFEVTDHIALTVSGDPKVVEVIEKFREKLMRIVLAETVAYEKPAKGYIKDWKLNEFDVIMGVDK